MGTAGMMSAISAKVRTAFRDANAPALMSRSGPDRAQHRSFPLYSFFWGGPQVYPNEYGRARGDKGKYWR